MPGGVGGTRPDSLTIPISIINRSADSFYECDVAA